MPTKNAEKDVVTATNQDVERERLIEHLAFLVVQQFRRQVSDTGSAAPGPIRREAETK